MSGTVGKRIALVDDDSLFADQVAAMLKHHGGLDTVAVENGENLFKFLDKNPVSCVLLDYALDGGNWVGRWGPSD